MPTILNGQYTLGRTLGSGVSCKVKLAKDSAGTRYAIKIIHSSESFQELIETEVSALSQLAHPNIVRLVEVNEGQQVNPKKGSKNVKYIVLELVGGGELFDFVALGGRLSEATARHFYRQLIEGLHYMHTNGYAHRDLKPENLILDKDFTLKISDFGFAAPIRGRDDSGLLQTQLGTASYMAPEIHLGKPYEGAKVDLFASAIILFVILTQRPPFSSANPKDPHYKLIAAGHADVFWNAHAEAEDGNDIYTAEFKDLFQKMMSLNPRDRPSIEEVMAHPWMQGAVPTAEEVKVDFTERKQRVDAEAHNEREGKRKQRQEAGNARNVRRGADNEEDGDQVENARDAWESLTIEEYGPFYQQYYMQFFMTSSPLDYFEDLVHYLTAQHIDYRISGENLRLKFNTTIAAEVPDADGEEEESKAAEPDQEVKVDIQVLQVSEHKYAVKFSYRDLQTKQDISSNAAIQHFMGIRDADNLQMFVDTTFEEGQAAQ